MTSPLNPPLFCLLALIVFLFSCLPAAADQTDPRLDDLFEELRVADNPHRARVLVERIWTLWSRSGQAEVDAVFAQGLEAMAAGRLEPALEHFTRVIELAPDFAEGWNKRATVHYLRGDHAASMADIRRTLALEPRHFGALSGMGLIFMALDDTVGALRAFEAVSRLYPNAPDTRQRLRQLRQRLRDEAI